MFPRSLMKLSGAKGILILLFVLTTVRALLIIAQTWLLAQAIVGLWSGETLHAQALLIAGFFFCFMGGHLILTIQEKQLGTYAGEQTELLRQALLKKVFTQGPALTQASGTGSITTTVLDGIDNVEIYIRLMLPKLTGVIIIPVFLLVVVFILDWISGLVLLLTVPIVIVFMIILGKTAQSKAAKQYKVFQVLSNHFIDSLRGVDTLKLFGISKLYASNVYKVSEQFRKATMATLRVVTLSGAVLDFFCTLSIAIVAVFLGVRLLDGSLLFLPALTSLILAPEYFRPIRDYAADYHASLDGKNALDAVQDILSANSTESTDSSDSTESTADNKTVENEDAERDIPLWQADSCLSVQNLQLSLNGVPTLSDVTFTVRGFSKIGIIGMSGAGKTSLINVISGFWQPDSANIQIDNPVSPELTPVQSENYCPASSRGTQADICTLSSFKQTSWQKQLIYLPQEPYIFHASLRDNIVFYHPEATDAQVEDAVRQAGLQELVQELPEGLATKVGEGARALSGGQAQRVALARTFFDKARSILIVDEPTAHLDIETELELKERMLPLMEDRLVFFATHRLHWMKEMDYILVLEAGHIVEAGTAEELIESGGTFASLIHQNKVLD